MIILNSVITLYISNKYKTNVFNSRYYYPFQAFIHDYHELRFVFLVFFKSETFSYNLVSIRSASRFKTVSLSFTSVLELHCSLFDSGITSTFSITQDIFIFVR